MIEQFTKETFESYLGSSHSPYQSLGLVDGEYAYTLPLDNQTCITIRSSVKSNGLSASVGKDSIRCWLVSGNKPLGSKVSKWTTRQPGWQNRLTKNIKQLAEWRMFAGDCKECGLPKGIFKARTEGNKGRLFARCREHNGFMWLDEPIKTSDIYFSEESKNGNNFNSRENREQVACSSSPKSNNRSVSENSLWSDSEINLSQDNNPSANKDDRALQELPKNPNSQQKQAIKEDSHGDSDFISTYQSPKAEVAYSEGSRSVVQLGTKSNEDFSCDKASKHQSIEKSNLQKLPKNPNAQQQRGTIETGNSIKTFSEENHDTSKTIRAESIPHQGQAGGDKNSLWHTDATAYKFSDESKESSVNLQSLRKKNPNNQQQKAIEADIDADLRVLAGPGSGKTFVIEHRYKFLVDNGVDPDKIIVCTFGKQSATDMGQRIIKTCPTANLEQICTINALCYRLLAKWYQSSRWYNWRGPKEWQIKKTLEDIIGPLWGEKEKPSAQEIYNWINRSKYLGLTTDDSYLWFADTLGQQRGAWLYEIRSKFDAWLNRNKFLTFADQLFLVEQRLKNDSNWRAIVQERFSHVIVDEMQDTSGQAIRILVTISLDPGQNTVYENEVE